MLIPGTVHDLNIQCLLYICLQFTVIRVHVIFFVNESLGGPTMKIAYRWQAEVLWAISRLPSLFWSLVDQQYQCMFDIWNSTNQPTNQRASHSTFQPTNFKHESCNIGHSRCCYLSAPCVAKALVLPEPAQPHPKKMPPCSNFIRALLQSLWKFMELSCAWISQDGWWMRLQ